jgi:hypothetical protein
MANLVSPIGSDISAEQAMGMLSDADPVYAQIIKDIAENKADIRNNSVAIRTILGLGLLERELDHLEFDDLTSRVYRVSGFGIHRENYKSVEEFRLRVGFFAKTVKRLATVGDRSARIRFYDCGLVSACLEGRVDAVEDFDRSGNSEFTVLKYELAKFKSKYSKSYPIDLSEFSSYLAATGVLESLHIDPSAIADNPSITKMIGVGFIKGPTTTSFKILGAVMTYIIEHQHLGLDHLKRYLLEQADFSDAERASMDRHLSEFCDRNTDLCRKYILPLRTAVVTGAA